MVVTKPSATYDFDELIQAFRRLGLKEGDTVYVISALWRMPGYRSEHRDACSAYYKALREVVGEFGTIAVPTGTQNLCNTQIPFDVATTPSHERGVFSEYVRQLPQGRRSFHPFNSYAAIGPKAGFICDDVSRHAYGPWTPEARLIELDARIVNIGVPPNICTSVHHVEQMMAVPYRYTKEFMHPVVRDGRIEAEPFYLYVWYRDTDLVRSLNKPLFDELKNVMAVRGTSLGRGRMYSYSAADFWINASRIFKDNIYIWCEGLPTIRPWRK